MMQHTDLLLTLAQLFVALAGFAGILAALGRFRLAPEPAAFRAHVVIAVALLALLASLLPLVLDAARLPNQAMMRLSASFLGSGAIAICAWAWQRLRPPRSAGPRDARIAATAAYAIIAALVIALFAVGAGFVADLAPAIYLSALFFCIALCAFHFFALVLAIELGGNS
jgi:hypothetical protein